MSLGIDPGTVLRFANGQLSASCHGAQGAPPCRLHENGYVWSRNRMARQTSREGMVVFEQVWHQLLAFLDEDGRAGNDGQLPFCDQVVAEALRQLAPPDLSGKVALAVDNSLSEDLQDMILGICSRAHLSNVDLLWRPVAILLDYLDRNPRCRLTAQSRVLVVDAESSRPEATALKLREIDGMLVPVRRFFRKDQDTLESDWRSEATTKILAEQLTQGTNIGSNELLQGAFSADFYQYRDGEHKEKIWVKSGAEYVPLAFKNELDELLAGDGSLDQLINSIDEPEADLVLWHGWPFRTRTFDVNSANVIVPADGVSRGCRIYAERVERGLPTYLELMPALAIMSKNPESNRDEFSPIIEQKEYLGGQTIHVKPINRFSLDQQITELKIILRRDDWADPKQVKFIGIPPVDNPAPITITGEMKPGQGKLKLWLTSRDNQQDDLFGERSRIEINWDTMKDYIQPQQSPETYPAMGLINGGNIEHTKAELARFVGASNATLTTRLKIPSNPRQLTSILNPTNTNHPGLFGTVWVDDPEVDDLARKIAQKISRLLHGNNNERFRLLNYMFSYAPESFAQELRDIYSGEGLPDDVKWNGAYAPGRVFSTPGELSILIKYLIRTSGDKSWPKRPNVTYADKYFWSIFRCISYHEIAANIDMDLADKTCQIICNYIEHRNRSNWAPLVQWENGGSIENAKKFCLCAILFLTRVRRYKHPGFLKAGDDLTNRVTAAIEGMPVVNFVGMDMRNVNQLVLRYIRNEADDSDERAVSGLVTEMA